MISLIRYSLISIPENIHNPVYGVFINPLLFIVSNAYVKAS